MIVKNFSISSLVKKLEKIANENRHDLVSNIMRDVFEKRMEKNPDLIVSSEDIKQIWSTVYNLNPNSNFKEKLNEVFEDTNNNETILEGSPFRIAGLEEDFRPTPTEKTKSIEETIKDSSFNYIQKAAHNNVVNPQYHFERFLSIKTAGENSGVALWSISFNTKNGISKINVPVTVINGKTLEPKVFYTYGNSKGIELTPENVKNYSLSYAPQSREASTELSGFEQIGNTTLISENQNIKEAGYSSEDKNVSLSYSIPLDESLIASVDEAEKNIDIAIEKARDFVESKIKTSENKGSMNINLQISYSGNLGLDGNEIKLSKENPNVEGVFAFNASEKTRSGLKTITIPVIFKNNTCVANSFFSDGTERELNANNVFNYFSDKNKQTGGDDISKSFSEAFTSYLKHDATYGQILDEIKETVKQDDYKKASLYLEVISERFGENGLKQASAKYIDFIKEVANERNEENNQNFFKSNVDLLS